MKASLFFHQVKNSVAHLFFPHVCVGCHTDVLPTDGLICSSCLSQLPFTNYIETPNNTVEKLFYGKIPIHAAATAFYFSKHSLLQQLLFALKYHSQTQAGYMLGQLLGMRLQQSERFNSVQAIIPIPLNPKKLAKRGYNQATIIAQGIAQKWTKPIIEDVSIRIKNNETQTNKSRIERWQNVMEVFAVTNPNQLNGKHVLLVDDVITTGATIEACAKQLIQQCNCTISVAAVAVASQV